MKLGKYCSAVLYTMKFGEPNFLAERDHSGSFVIPRADLYVKDKEKETDRAVITGKNSLAVRLDTVFCHDTGREGMQYWSKHIIYLGNYTISGFSSQPKKMEPVNYLI